MIWKEVQTLNKSDFKRCTGVTPEVFHQMASALEQTRSQQRKHPNRGRKSKLGIEDKILVLLMYYREYRTMFHIGMTYGISEAVVCRTIRETESLLLQDKRFHLPGKKALQRSENTFEVLLIDVSETPIERPKKNNANVIRGKKKRHTLKSQLVADKKTRTIICTAITEGRKHDFNLFKRSKTHLCPHLKVQTGSGYQGIQKIHANSEVPKKKQKESVD